MQKQTAQEIIDEVEKDEKKRIRSQPQILEKVKKKLEKEDKENEKKGGKKLDLSSRNKS
jgi:hypothetical protein